MDGLGGCDPGRRAFLSLVAAVPAAVLLSGCGLVEDVSDQSPGGIALATAAPSGQRNLVIIGDSLSTGYGTSAQQAWPSLLAPLLTIQEPGTALVNGARNGSGYLAQGIGGDTFGTEVARVVDAWTRTVLFFGSDNDLGRASSRLRQAAVAAFQDAARRAPDARRVAVGPLSYSSIAGSQLLAIRDSLQAAAQQEGVEFVDPIAADWMSIGAQGFLGPDGEHPNAAGHVRLAGFMAAVLGLNGSPATATAAAG